jgi:rhodanese-related sulfurtransferase
MDPVPRTADTHDVQRLITEGAQLLEVLPASAFEREHLPDAINIPLPRLTESEITAEGLDPQRPVVVYCYDHECDLSSRGAALLEAYGFAEVYDYDDSKTAWMGAGLPVEGSVSASTRAGTIARPLPTCTLGEELGDITPRFETDGLCAVVDDEQVVLGIVRQDAGALGDTTPVRAVMQPAPPSVRPNVTAADLAVDMDKDHRGFVLVSTSHGRLIGIIATSDLHGHH